jgi:hypothetical protein
VTSDPAAIREQLVRVGVLVPREVAEPREVVPYWHLSPPTLRLLGSEEERQSVLRLDGGMGWEREP